MRIYRRNKIWWIEYSRGRAESLRTEDEEEAKRILKATPIVRYYSVSQRPPLSMFTKRYLKRTYTSKKTYAADNLSLKLLKEAIGDIRIDKITPAKVQKFINACNARGCKPVSINSYLGHIRAALRWAETIFPRFKAPRIKLLRAGKPLPRPLTNEQVKKLLDKCREVDPTFEPYLIFYLFMGIRRAEILAIKWEDVNLAEGLIRVRGKGDKERMVPILPQVASRLSTLPREGEYVFPRQHPDGLTHRFQALAKVCEIQTRLHDLRHTCGTHLLTSGNPLEVVQAVLGHASVVTTQIYAKVVAESLKKVKLQYDTHT